MRFRFIISSPFFLISAAKLHIFSEISKQIATFLREKIIKCGAGSLSRAHPTDFAVTPVTLSRLGGVPQLLVGTICLLDNQVAVFPHTNGLRHLACVHTLLDVQRLHVFARENLWQVFQQALGLVVAGTVVAVSLGDGVAKELHLAPQVIVQAPANKILYRLLPLTTVGHIEHTSLQIGNDVGTEREVFEGAVLAFNGLLLEFIVQLLRQLVGLRTEYLASSRAEVVDVGLQVLGKLRIILAILRNGRADGLFRDGAEVDARDGSVHQHVAEVLPTLVDGSTGIEVEEYLHARRDTLCTHARLTVLAVGVEGQTDNLELLTSLAVALQRVKLLNLVDFQEQEVSFRLLQTHHEGG